MTWVAIRVVIGSSPRLLPGGGGEVDDVDAAGREVVHVHGDHFAGVRPPAVVPRPVSVRVGREDGVPAEDRGLEEARRTRVRPRGVAYRQGQRPPGRAATRPRSWERLAQAGEFEDSKGYSAGTRRRKQAWVASAVRAIEQTRGIGASRRSRRGDAGLSTSVRPRRGRAG